ncbi:hypothetical protein ES319_A10G118200v1 [Gossypium barbadense]|uniref:Uncharacterized protein n=3 Tax=Gossypium TaxID=3633 RepID=A0A5J5U1Q3_GOSBA|nr:hypothetical protein ES319_A10G118200v1 [Gossypium barbadense]TYG98584.1 hypothetical protein ES288_A10G128800v1 [Gossypium darwinii]
MKQPFRRTNKYIKLKMRNLFNSLDGKSIFVQDIIGRRGVEVVNKSCFSELALTTRIARRGLKLHREEPPERGSFRFREQSKERDGFSFDLLVKIPHYFLLKTKTSFIDSTLSSFFDHLAMASLKE